MRFDIIDNLTYRVERRPPPKMPEGVTANLPGADDIEEITPLDEADIGYAEGQSFVIEYVDAKGCFSRRSITVWSIALGRDGVPVLVAQCHHRHAQRTFRVDRVKAAIDLIDGEVHEPPAQFFVECFGMSELAAKRTGRRGITGSTPNDRWTALRNRIKPAAHVLSALSHSDGLSRVCERDVAMQFFDALEPGVIGHGVSVDKVRKYLQRLRPNRQTIADALDDLERWNPDEIIALLSAGQTLIEADGILTPEETALLDAISVELIGTPITG